MQGVAEQNISSSANFVTDPDTNQDGSDAGSSEKRSSDKKRKSSQQQSRGGKNKKLWDSDSDSEFPASKTARFRKKSSDSASTKQNSSSDTLETDKTVQGSQRPLRNSFCKALVNMTEQLSKNTTTAAEESKETPDTGKKIPEPKQSEVKNDTKKDIKIKKVLEQLSQNHFKDNKDYPTASKRSQAMLEVFLEEHRAGCIRCNATLNRKGIRPNKKQDKPPNTPVENKGATESGYPEDVSQLKALLAAKDNKISALEKKIQLISRDIANDDTSPEDIVELLRGVSEPTPAAIKNKFAMTQGYRLIDMKLMATALQSSQECRHGSLVMVELHRDLNPQEDLATRLAYVCTVCGPKTIFPTSSFSTLHPENFSINKQLLPLLGPAPYYRLCSFVQFPPDIKDHTLPSYQLVVRPKMVMSTDSTIYSLRRPFEPELPSDPTANICQKKDKAGEQKFSIPSSSRMSNTISSSVKIRGDLLAPPDESPEKPVEEGGGDQSRPVSPPSSTPTDPKSKAKSVKTLKACPELPVGSRICLIKPGTRIASKNVQYLTSEKTGLDPGVYGVHNGGKSKIIVVRNSENDPIPNFVDKTVATSPKFPSVQKVAPKKKIIANNTQAAKTSQVNGSKATPTSKAAPKHVSKQKQKVIKQTGNRSRQSSESSINTVTSEDEMAVDPPLPTVETNESSLNGSRRSLRKNRSRPIIIDSDSEEEPDDDDWRMS